MKRSLEILAALSALVAFAAALYGVGYQDVAAVAGALSAIGFALIVRYSATLVKE